MTGSFNLASYKHDGFTVVQGIVPPSDVARIAAAFEDLKRQASSFDDDTFIGPTYFNLHRDCDPFDKKIVDLRPVAGELRRVTYPYLVSETLNEYRIWEPLLRIVQQILGDNLVQLVNQANFNPPKRGTGWGWHQDYRFRRQGLQNVPASFVQCLLAVDSCSEENGGLRLVPRSDQLGPLTLDTNPEDFQHCVNPDDIVQPALQPGDVVLFNPYIIHGSTPNRSNRDRRVYINGYAAAGAVTHGIPVMRDSVIVSHIEGVMEYEDDLTRLPPAAKY